MARTWFSIRVELVSGRGEDYWPRPGRVFAASRSHTFGQLARSVDNAFARWDLAHLHQFVLADGTELTDPQSWDDQQPEESLDSGRTALGVLKPGAQFAYVFDLGDDWTHLCTVERDRVDPLDTLGIVPELPMPYWGWGNLPDQYGRLWEEDDGESSAPRSPRNPLRDLPPILPWWGPPRR
ncbi:MAG: plasmid pRiA4b ORF-3 family protein [Actinomycetales bacterium]|nr:plasmid pRiA4b ORF-3 family protein [Actinomycetales bacterium]